MTHPYEAHQCLRSGGSFRYSVTRQASMSLTFWEYALLIALWWVCAGIYNEAEWRAQQRYDTALAETYKMEDRR